MCDILLVIKKLRDFLFRFINQTIRSWMNLRNLLQREMY